MLVKFRNVNEESIKQSFLKVIERYDSLHQYEIVLTQRRVKSSTMQAQPTFRPVDILKGVKRYEVKLGVFVRDSKELRVTDLPQDVLTGWFAHELGHIVDYEPYNNFQMMKYGFKYLTSEKFRIEAEQAADYIAIKHGFHEEIIATKEFILDHDLVEESYKQKIRKYYLSVEDVKMCTVPKDVINPKLEL